RVRSLCQIMSATICIFIVFFLLYLYIYFLFSFFFNDTAPTEIYTLSLHDALPISVALERSAVALEQIGAALWAQVPPEPEPPEPDRKSTRLNSSHVAISYAVFCLKKKKEVKRQPSAGT